MGKTPPNLSAVTKPTSSDLMPWNALWLASGDSYIKHLSDEGDITGTQPLHICSAAVSASQLLCVTASNYKIIASEYGVPTGNCGTCLDWPRVAERFAGIDYRAVQSDKPELSRGDHWLTCIDVPCIAVWDVRCLHDFVDMGYITHDEICNK